MPNKTKKNKLRNNDCLHGIEVRSSRQPKFSGKSGQKANTEVNESEHNQSREKLMNNFSKRLKRLGVWLISFISSFLCGACMAFLLW